MANDTLPGVEALKAARARNEVYEEANGIFKPMRTTATALEFRMRVEFAAAFVTRKNARESGMS